MASERARQTHLRVGVKAPYIAQTAKLDQIAATIPFVGPVLGSGNFTRARQALRSILGFDGPVPERYSDVREWRAREAGACGASIQSDPRQVAKDPCFRVGV